MNRVVRSRAPQVHFPVASASPPVRGGRSRLLRPPLTPTCVGMNRVVRSRAPQVHFPVASASPPVRGGRSRLLRPPLTPTYVGMNLVVRSRAPQVHFPVASASPPVRGGRPRLLCARLASTYVVLPVQALRAVLDNIRFNMPTACCFRLIFIYLPDASPLMFAQSKECTPIFRRDFAFVQTLELGNRLSPLGSTQKVS